MSAVKLTRYDYAVVSGAVSMRPLPSGEWVRASDAATLIEAQAARIVRLEQALKPFAEPWFTMPDDTPPDTAIETSVFTWGDFLAARALNGGE